MIVVGRFSIPATHPSLPGHFPGNPVVRGVVLLDAVLACLRGTTLATAKFTAPVRAGEDVEVAAEGARFACTVGGTPVLHGTVTPA
jgi:3-hydroxymyristoyl/3-hydroxydecanoyl-(acyl carrier protein) dehydratase